MQYRKEEWVKNALIEGDVYRLKKFSERLNNECGLSDILSRECLKIVASLSDENLEIIQEAFPEVISKVSFETALMQRNIWLLDKNRDIYFAEGWKNTFKNILFLDYGIAKSIELSDEFLEYADEVYQVLKWVEENIGEIPEISGMCKMMSILAVMNPRKKVSGGKGKEELDAYSELEKKFRIITKDTRFETNIFENDCSLKIRNMPPKKYSQYIISLNSNYYVRRIFLNILKRCDIDRIVIKNELVLQESSFIKFLLVNSKNKDKIQKKICDVYKKYSNLNVLYEQVKECKVVEGFSFILAEYFKENAVENQPVSVLESKDDEGV